MHHPLDDHPHFTRWEDPQTGVASYVLSEHVAPLQKALYFVTPSIKADSRWLWFRYAYPPSRSLRLAAVSLDPDHPDIRTFPACELNGNPLIADDGRSAYVPIAEGVYRQDLDGEPSELFRVPKDLIDNRKLMWLVTDLTMSSDGKWFLMDSQFGNEWVIWLASADGEKVEFKTLRRFHWKHHHAMFSLHNPKLLMINQGPGRDPYTGRKNDMNIRIWVMDTDGTRYEPIQPDLWFGRNCMSCHEWWTPDGCIDWCDYQDGIYEVDMTLDWTQRRRKLIWPRPMWHGQADATKRFYCGDQNPYKWDPCSVWLFDRSTGKDVAIASDLPRPPLNPGDWRAYHADPHPHFSEDGQYVIYTTTALGTLSAAVTPVSSAWEKM